MNFNLKADKIEVQFSDEQPTVLNPDVRQFVHDLLMRLVKQGKIKVEDAVAAEQEVQKSGA